MHICTDSLIFVDRWYRNRWLSINIARIRLQVFHICNFRPLQRTYRMSLKNLHGLGTSANHSFPFFSVISISIIIPLLNCTWKSEKSELQYINWYSFISVIYCENLLNSIYPGSVVIDPSSGVNLGTQSTQMLTGNDFLELANRAIFLPVFGTVSLTYFSNDL